VWAELRNGKHNVQERLQKPAKEKKNKNRELLTRGRGQEGRNKTQKIRFGHHKTGEAGRGIPWRGERKREEREERGRVPRTREKKKENGKDSCINIWDCMREAEKRVSLGKNLLGARSERRVKKTTKQRKGQGRRN